MPNWCYSSIEFEGPENEIKEILKTEIDFEKICPTPKELFNLEEIPEKTRISAEKENIKKYGHANWYDWRVANWGVKWNPTGKHKTITLTSPTKINATIITAWGLPLVILKKISLMNPQTIIKIIDCQEEAGFFVGDCTILNGCIIEDNIHEPSREEMRQRGMLCEDET